MTKHGPKRKRHFAEFYQTPINEAVEIMQALGLGPGLYWEMFAGEGNICRAINIVGGTVYASDVKDYGKGYPLDLQADFFDLPVDKIPDYTHVVSNPPYGVQNSLIKLIVKRLLELRPRHGFIVLLLPAEYDSGSTRREIFKDCPNFRGKVKLLHRVKWFGDGGGTENHAWFVWGPTLHHPLIDYIG